MKTNHSDLSNPGTGEPCCAEIIIWNNLKLKIRKYTRWILGSMALIQIVFITFGYTLDPEVIRLLWIGVNAAMLIVILPVIILIGRRINQCCEAYESD